MASTTPTAPTVLSTFGNTDVFPDYFLNTSTHAATTASPLSVLSEATGYCNAAETHAILHSKSQWSLVINQAGKPPLPFPHSLPSPAHPRPFTFPPPRLTVPSMSTSLGYSISCPATRHCIISLNTVVYSLRHTPDSSADIDPLGQFAWLEAELATLQNDAARFDSRSCRLRGSSPVLPSASFPAPSPPTQPCPLCLCLCKPHSPPVLQRAAVQLHPRICRVWFRASAPARVWILGHIPPVLDSYSFSPQWHRSYVVTYLALVKRFSSIIVAQFFGDRKSVV